MSRIGKLPIPLPNGVTATVAKSVCTVKGPKGELQLPIHHHVSLDIGDGVITVKVADPDDRRDRALWGLFRMLVSNLIEGVTKGFSKQLEIRGVGYRASVEGKELVLYIGFSHPVRFSIPEGIAMTVEKNIVIVTGIDKQLVGEVAAEIRRYRPPEPYKGKGIRYVGEYVRQKAGKVVKAAGAK